MPMWQFRHAQHIKNVKTVNSAAMPTGISAPAPRIIVPTGALEAKVLEAKVLEAKVPEPQIGGVRARKTARRAA